MFKSGIPSVTLLFQPPDQCLNLFKIWAHRPLETIPEFVLLCFLLSVHFPHTRENLGLVEVLKGRDCFKFQTDSMTHVRDELAGGNMTLVDRLASHEGLGVGRNELR